MQDRQMVYFDFKLFVIKSNDPSSQILTNSLFFEKNTNSLQIIAKNAHNLN